MGDQGHRRQSVTNFYTEAPELMREILEELRAINNQLTDLNREVRIIRDDTNAIERNR